ncbi:cytidine deaminase [Alkaliflexus imshenetskii]|uniref:cytidine deaminase n=1 Tax=Alkaliflexus imshenetskii TaxID=286730 RepID=UPI00047AB5C9|nr:cytidine deaminase [Alkaliflexus imshenetskii]
MKQVEININIHAYEAVDDLNPQQQELVNAAIDAAKSAWAPYSGFQVGAALVLENGETVIGSNQENAAFPSGMCAERVALYQAGARFPGVAVVELAIVALKKGELIAHPVAPCGACRQVFVETEHRAKKPFSLVLAGRNQIFCLDRATNLLPLAFNADEL